MDGRAHKRIAVDREVECRISGEKGWVKLYDLSAGGAMIEIGRSQLAVGDGIELNLYDMITVHGQIVWVIGNNAGVRFSGQIGDWILERLGISATSFEFDELQPRDRFGQPLAEVPQTTTQISGAEAGVPEEVPGARDEAPHRREERLEIDAKAAIGSAPDNGVEGRLMNLSPGGCKVLDRAGIYKPGDTVWLQFEAMEPWKGVVRWVEGEQVGIEFERPFHPSIVEHLIAKKSGAVCFKSD